MVPGTYVASPTPTSPLTEQAEELLGAAADHLELVPAESATTPLLQRLAEIARRLEQRAALSDRSCTAAAELLVRVLRMQCELLDREVTRRVRSLSEIRTALADLRELSPREMLQSAPVVLSRELTFTRTMISTVRGSLWLPQRLYIAHDETDPRSQPFYDFVAGARFQLADAPLETELVRKRCGALVPAAQNDKRTFKDIVEVSGCSSYIAAPITLQGRAIGILHADRPERDGVLSMEHLDQLEAFAECLSVAFESAVLEAKVAQQLLEVKNLYTHMNEMEIRAMLTSSPQPNGHRHNVLSFRPRQTAAHVLTAREREIMDHVATGATNSQIARCLVISEATVKSHLKHIAKKLNTTSRAAAVAVYNGIATGDYRESP